MNVYFGVSGKLQVSIGASAVSVLGPGNCFGDWGVLNGGEPRNTKLSCMGPCELLVVHGFNFMRSVDPRVLGALRDKQKRVEQGLTWTDATTDVDEVLRKNGEVLASAQSNKIIR